MDKAREFLEKTAAGEEYDGVSRLTFPAHQAHRESSFYEYFITRGVRVDRVQQGSISCSLKVPPRLTDRNGKLAAGAIASLVDEIGAAAIRNDGDPMDVSVDMSISYLSEAKMNEPQKFLPTNRWRNRRYAFDYKDELEIICRCLGQQGGYFGTHVLIRNKATGEVVAEGRHSLFRKHASKM